MNYIAGRIEFTTGWNSTLNFVTERIYMLANRYKDNIILYTTYIILL